MQYKRSITTCYTQLSYVALIPFLYYLYDVTMCNEYRIREIFEGLNFRGFRGLEFYTKIKSTKIV